MIGQPHLKRVASLKTRRIANNLEFDYRQLIAQRATTSQDISVLTLMRTPWQLESEVRLSDVWVDDSESWIYTLWTIIMGQNDLDLVRKVELFISIP